MKKNSLEVVLGGIVLIIAGFCLLFVYRESQTVDPSGYTLYASFSRADGLNRGSDVKLSGIKVGTITSLELDPKTYMAKVGMGISKNILIPDDTVAEIVSEGFMGSRYIALVPGGSEKNLSNGDSIEFTQSAVSFESLISRFIFNSSGQAKEEDEAEAEEETQPDDDVKSKAEETSEVEPSSEKTTSVDEKTESSTSSSTEAKNAVNS